MEERGVSSVELSDCLQHLLFFTLQSSSLSLSPDFCSTLLQHDPHNPQFQLPDLTQGVPPYPLYKTLAFALGSMSSSTHNESFQEIKHHCNALVHIFKNIKAELHVQDPYFSQLKDGVKTVEGRCAIGDYNRIQSGDLILFNKCLMLEVQDIRHYSSFFEMLKAENLDTVLPGVLTVEEGVQIYRKIYTKEKEQVNGVLAISVRRPASQPYTVLSDIISGLGYRGIQSLLGLKQTVGTISDALPPPRSILFSSFALPHRSDVVP